MKTILASIVLSLLVNAGFAQTIPTKSLYLGQSPPGITPKIFNLSVDTGYGVTERVAISPDGKEIYYGEVFNESIRKTKCYTYSNGAWNGPIVLFDGFDAPALSASGDTMFLLHFQNHIPYSYFSVRNDTGWTTPSKFWKGINLYYLQKTNAGNYYASVANSGISKIVISNSDTAFNSLEAPMNNIGGDFYMSRDDSFIIFTKQTGDHYKMDLFISYRKKDATWTYPKSLGSAINISFYNVAPYVTRDNKYLFYMGADTKSSFIYWVQIDKVLDIENVH